MKEFTVATEALELLTSREAREYRLIPFEIKGDQLGCYGEKGYDYENIVMEVEVLTGKHLKVVFLAEEEFSRLLGRHYRQECQTRNRGVVSLTRGKGFLYDLIEEAYREHASDIHLESYEDRCRVRFRIDGKLLERHVIEKGNYATLVNQVKILANLDISEKRLPQDGRILHDSGGCRFDVRVSSLPTIHGEKIVMRLLTRQMELLDLKNLGFSSGQLKAYLSAIRHPHGLVLISGPTGSGKSTTLYATLRLLNDVVSNILTIEDPVEYTLEGVNQVQLKEEIGLTFTSALRTFLRQDPDVIMVGEMRDTETMTVAVTAAETGHLVFSTLHTNSAASAVDRMIDVFPPFQQQQIRVQLAGVLEGVVAQQLLPRQEGGRVAAYEVMLAVPAIRNLIREEKSFQIPSIIQTNKKMGMQTMDDAIYDLYMKSYITAETAISFAHDAAGMSQKINLF